MNRYQLIALISILCVSVNAFSKKIEHYTINPGDVLSIQVWSEETLSTPEVLVRPDGFISMPLVGDILAGNKTIPEVSESVVKTLKKILKDEPRVSISIKSIGGNSVYVLGKVNRPGRYIMFAKTDVTQALALAGGITSFANKNKIKILRRYANGIQMAIKFDYHDVSKGKHLEENIILKSGDVVIVP